MTTHKLYLMMTRRKDVAQPIHVSFRATSDEHAIRKLYKLIQLTKNEDYYFGTTFKKI